MKKEGCNLLEYKGSRGIRQVERHRDIRDETPEEVSDERIRFGRGGTLPVGLTKGEEDATPLGLCGGGAHTTQGSACGATLGYYPESRWDSQKVGEPLESRWDYRENVYVFLFLFGIPKEIWMLSHFSLGFIRKWVCLPLLL